MVFFKKGFLSAILFTELFKLVCYELNFRADYNLNRIFTRSDHTGNTAGLSGIHIDRGDPESG